MKNGILRKATGLLVLILLAGTMSPAISAEASGKTKVKVVSSIDDDGSVTKFSYDKNTGLLKKESDPSASRTYAYNKDGKMTKMALKGDDTTYYTLGKNGHVVSSITKGPNAKAGNIYKESFSYRSGKLASWLLHIDGVQGYSDKTVTGYIDMTRKVSWKNGRITSIKETTVDTYTGGDKDIKDSRKASRSYAYDKNGMKKKVKTSDHGEKTTISYKNEYDGKSLSKQTYKEHGYKKVIKFTYKTVEVGAKYVSAIQKQRKLILWDETWLLPTL